MSPDRLISSAVLLTQSLLAVHAPAPSNRQGSDERTARIPGPARSMIIDLLLPRAASGTRSHDRLAYPGVVPCESQGEAGVAGGELTLANGLAPILILAFLAASLKGVRGDERLRGFRLRPPAPTPQGPRPTPIL